MRELKARISLDTVAARRNAKQLSDDVNKTGTAAAQATQMGIGAYMKLAGAIGAAVAVARELEAVEANAARARSVRAAAEAQNRATLGAMETQGPARALAGLPGFGSPTDAVRMGLNLAGRYAGVSPETAQLTAFPLAAKYNLRHDQVAQHPAVQQAMEFTQASQSVGALSGNLIELLQSQYGASTQAQIGQGLRDVYAAAAPSSRVSVPQLIGNIEANAALYGQSGIRELSNFITALTGPVPAARVDASLTRLANIPGLVAADEGAQAYMGPKLLAAGFKATDTGPRAMALALGKYVRDGGNEPERQRRLLEIQQNIPNFSNEQRQSIAAIGTGRFLRNLRASQTSVVTQDQMRAQAQANLTVSGVEQAAKYRAEARKYDPILRGDVREADYIADVAAQDAVAGMGAEQYRAYAQKYDVGREGSATTARGITKEQLDKLLGANRLYPGLIRGLRSLFSSITGLEMGSRYNMGSLPPRAQDCIRHSVDLRRLHERANKRNVYRNTEGAEIEQYDAKTREVIQFLRSARVDVRTGDLEPDTTTYGGEPGPFEGQGGPPGGEGGGGPAEGDLVGSLGGGGAGRGGIIASQVIFVGERRSRLTHRETRTGVI